MEEYQHHMDEKGNCVLVEGITRILSNAKYYVSQSSSIHLPSSIKSIDSAGFDHCANLTQLTISSDNPYFRSESNCILSKDGKVLVCGCNGSVIPEGVVQIGKQAFRLRENLTSIRIPGSVQSIQLGAFFLCSNLQYIKIPDSVTEIGSSAFEGCHRLAAIRLPRHLSELSDCILEYCCSLTSVEIPDKVTRIGTKAFGGCLELQTVKFGKGLKEIGEYAFVECNSLQSVNLENVVSIDRGAFCSCMELKSVSLSCSVRQIGSGAFSCCSKLEHLILLYEDPNTVPLSVACFNDDNVEELFEEKSAIDPYQPVRKITLSVPCGSGEAYRRHPFFSRFKKVREIE